MAIRKNTNPQPMEQREERPRFSWAIPSRDRGRQSQQMDLQPEMRDLLMRNGMQAHVVSNGSADVGSDRLGNESCQQVSLQYLYGHCGQRLLYAQELRPCTQCQRSCGHGTARLSCWYRRVWTNGAHRNATTLFRLDTTQSGWIPSSQSWRTIVLPRIPDCA